MFGSSWKEVEVQVAAEKAWQLYGTIKLGELAAKHILERIDVIEGDGDVGTLIKVTFKPGFGISCCKERYTMINNEKMVREAEVVEGGYLDFGFTLYRVRIEVKNNANDETRASCTVKITVEYEVKEEAAANASLASIEPYAILMKFANEQLLSST